MIIFESLSTTSKASGIFKAAGAVAKIGTHLKLNHHNTTLSKSLIHTVVMMVVVDWWSRFRDVHKLRFDSTNLSTHLYLTSGANYVLFT